MHSEHLYLSYVWFAGLDGHVSPRQKRPYASGWSSCGLGNALRCLAPCLASIHASHCPDVLMPHTAMIRRSYASHCPDILMPHTALITCWLFMAVAALKYSQYSHLIHAAHCLCILHIAFSSCLTVPLMHVMQRLHV